MEMFYCIILVGNVVTEALIRERQEGQNLRRCDNGRGGGSGSGP